MCHSRTSWWPCRFMPNSSTWKSTKKSSSSFSTLTWDLSSTSSLQIWLLFCRKPCSISRKISIKMTSWCWWRDSTRRCRMRISCLTRTCSTTSVMSMLKLSSGKMLPISWGTIPIQVFAHQIKGLWSISSKILLTFSSIMSELTFRTPFRNSSTNISAWMPLGALRSRPRVISSRNKSRLLEIESTQSIFKN